MYAATVYIFWHISDLYVLQCFLSLAVSRIDHTYQDAPVQTGLLDKCIIIIIINPNMYILLSVKASDYNTLSTEQCPFFACIKNNKLVTPKPNIYLGNFSAAMEDQRRELTPEQDALEHIAACRDKHFLEERYIDAIKGRMNVIL